MAVNLANAFCGDQYEVHLCTTRADGALGPLVKPEVGRISLRRRSRFDIGAVARLASYIRVHRIQILHAHGTSLFIAVAAATMAPRSRVVWHDHFGRNATDQRPVWLYRLAAARLTGVIAVSDTLAEWSRRELAVQADRVWYVPNFVSDPGESSQDTPDLPGEQEFRIVCVANLRPQKDHLTLIRALRNVVDRVPKAHLLLLGESSDPSYAKSIDQEIERLGLSSSVSWLGSRGDVPAVLNASGIGVLSSASEGLPLALIEYGMASLPAIATRVGQCEEVLDYGSAGILVEPGNVPQLAEALVSLLDSPASRASLGARLKQRVESVYSQQSVVERVGEIYDAVLETADESR